MTGCAPTVAQALLPFPQYCNNITGVDENLRSSTFTLQGCFPRRKLLRHVATIRQLSWSLWASARHYKSMSIRRFQSR